MKASLKGRHEMEKSYAIDTFTVPTGDAHIKASMIDATFAKGSSLNGNALSIEKPNSFIVDYNVPNHVPSLSVLALGFIAAELSFRDLSGLQVPVQDFRFYSSSPNNPLPLPPTVSRLPKEMEAEEAVASSAAAVEVLEYGRSFQWEHETMALYWYEPI